MLAAGHVRLGKRRNLRILDASPNFDGLPGSRLLYIGLARDLSQRFAQHTGLVSFPEAGCKRRHIERWFAENPTLGLSCFVQSTLAQVDTHRERDRYRRIAHDEEDLKNFASHDPSGLESAVIIEGQLIETYRLLHRMRPPWNKVGGSVAGAARAKDGTADGLLLLLDRTRDSLFHARRSVRALSDDWMATAFEAGPLHWARMEVVINAWERRATDSDIYKTLLSAKTNPDYRETGLWEQIEHMLRSGYLDGAPGTQSLS